MRQARRSGRAARKASKAWDRRPREQGIAVDQTQQRHRFAAQRVDDVPIIDDMAVPAIRVGSAARQRELVRPAEEHIEPVIVQPDAQAVADQPRGDAVEHLAQQEATGGGDGDHRLLIVGGPPGGQLLQHGALDGDAGCHPGIVPPDHLVDEAAIGSEIGEVPHATQQQRIRERRLEMAMRALDGAVLVRHAAVVAAGLMP